MDPSLIILLFGLLTMASCIITKETASHHNHPNDGPITLLFRGVFQATLVLVFIAAAWVVTALMFSLN